MPSGKPAQVLARYFNATLTLRRKTAGTWAEAPGTVQAFVDFSPSGVLRVAAAAGAVGGSLGGGGIAAESSGIAVYVEPAEDLRVGDMFTHEGSTYRVDWVGPTGSGPSSDVLRTCFARAQKAPGATP